MRKLNRKGEQNSYLERLLSRSLHALGRSLREAPKEPIPQGGSWGGDDHPGPGKIPGFNS